MWPMQFSKGGRFSFEVFSKQQETTRGVSVIQKDEQYKIYMNFKTGGNIIPIGNGGFFADYKEIYNIIYLEINIIIRERLNFNIFITNID